MSSKRFIMYRPLDSPIHRLDPVTKLIYVGAVNIMIFLVFEPITGFVIFLITWFIHKAAKLETGTITSLLKGLMPAMGLVYLVWNYTTARQAAYNATLIYQWNWVGVTDVALIGGTAVVSRIFVMVTITMTLFGSASQRDIITGFRKMKMPYAACLTIALAYRTINVLYDDMTRIQEAQMSRGLEYQQLNPAKFLSRSRYLVIPLIVSALNRATTITSAIESRGYQLGINRSYYYQPKMKAYEYVLNLIFIGSTIGFFILNVFYGWFTIPWFYSAILPYVITFWSFVAPVINPLLIQYIQLVTSFATLSNLETIIPFLPWSAVFFWFFPLLILYIIRKVIGRSKEPEEEN